MLLSHGPFDQTLPLSVIERITIKSKLRDRVAIQLEISNQIAKPRKEMNFANLVVLSPDQAAIDSLSTSVSAIANMIRTPAQNARKREFSLTKGDFTAMGFTDATPSRSMAQQKVFHNNYKMNLSFPEVDNLYVMLVSYREFEGRIFIGSITKETIFRNGAVPPRANVYQLSETVEAYGTSGSIWPGPVHRHNNVLMAGNQHIAVIQHPTVTSTRTPNYKIVDKRFLRAANNLDFDNASPRLAARRMFSDVELSRSEEGMVHG